MVHFDTHFLIQATENGLPARVNFRKWLKDGEKIGISSRARTEYLCGPLDAKVEDFAGKIFPAPVANLFNPIGRLADCMIAAVAIRCGAKLATLNGADFQPFVSPGLVLAR
jgi:hypothetical protein